MSNSHTLATFLTFAVCSVGAARAILRIRRAPLVSLIFLFGCLGHTIAAASLGRSIPPGWVAPLSWTGVVVSSLLVLAIFRVNIREQVKKQGEEK